MKYRPIIPAKSFPIGTVYADPPWSLQTKGVRRKLHYDRMTTEEIAEIPVGDLTTPDAHLWLWTTNAHLPEAFGVVKAWGFEYRALMTWAKNRMGTGWWLRGKTEQLLFCSKQKKPRANPGNVTTLLEAPVRQHSQKPEEVYDIIERLSPGPYLELFARNPKERNGWTMLSSPGEPEDPHGD